MAKNKKLSLKSIIIYACLYLFLSLCVVVLIMTMFSKKDADGAAELFGYQMRVVTSESMEECEHTDVSAYEIKDIPVRSMIFVETVPDDPEEAEKWYRDLEVGDVLTFRYVYTTQVTITHRISGPVEEKDGGFVINLAADNVNSDKDRLYQTIDTSIPNNTNYVIGKVVGQSYLLGFIMSFLMQPIGIILLIIIPCLVIILIEVFKIMKMFSSNKNEKDREEMEKKEKELEDLRRKISELEQMKHTESESQIAESSESSIKAKSEEGDAK